MPRARYKSHGYDSASHDMESVSRRQRVQEQSRTGNEIEGRKRTPLACDNCRRRKIRCSGQPSRSSRHTKCDACRHSTKRQDCVFVRVQSHLMEYVEDGQAQLRSTTSAPSSRSGHSDTSQELREPQDDFGQSSYAAIDRWMPPRSRDDPHQIQGSNDNSSCRSHVHSSAGDVSRPSGSTDYRRLEDRVSRDNTTRSDRRLPPPTPQGLPGSTSIPGFPTDVGFRSQRATSVTQRSQYPRADSIGHSSIYDLAHVSSMMPQLQTPSHVTPVSQMNEHQHTASVPRERHNAWSQPSYIISANASDEGQQYGYNSVPYGGGNYGWRPTNDCRYGWSR